VNALKAELLYEGKEKKVYQVSEQPGKLIFSYKSERTAFTEEGKESFVEKARLNNDISSRIFEYLRDRGMDTHYIKKLSDTEQLVNKTEMIPLKVVICNSVTPAMSKRLGIEENTILYPPIIELYYKNELLKNPLINDEHALFLTNITPIELQEVKEKALRVNKHLNQLFSSLTISLAVLKLEFGRMNGHIILSDEISPDTWKLLDKSTGEILQKANEKVYSGNQLEFYEKLVNRLEELK